MGIVVIVTSFAIAVIELLYKDKPSGGRRRSVTKRVLLLVSLATVGALFEIVDEVRSSRVNRERSATLLGMSAKIDGLYDRVSPELRDTLTSVSRSLREVSELGQAELEDRRYGSLSFQRGDFAGTDFREASFDQADFRGADLRAIVYDSKTRFPSSATQDSVVRALTSETSSGFEVFAEPGKEVVGRVLSRSRINVFHPARTVDGRTWWKVGFDVGWMAERLVDGGKPAMFESVHGEGIEVGDTIEVVYSRPDGLNLRVGPDLRTEVMGKFLAGSKLVVVGSAERNQGYVWWLVRPSSGWVEGVRSELFTEVR